MKGIEVGKILFRMNTCIRSAGGRYHNFFLQQYRKLFIHYALYGVQCVFLHLPAIVAGTVIRKLYKIPARIQSIIL